MRRLICLTFCIALSACGGAGGGGSPSAGPATGGQSQVAVTPSPSPSPSAPALHTFTIEVTCQGNDFTFAPGILGPNGHDNSPGPQAMTFAGQVLTYSLIDTTADVAITGVSASSIGFYVSVVVYKDGVQVATANAATGITVDFGLAPYNVN